MCRGTLDVLRAAPPVLSMCSYKRILEEEKSKHADLDPQTGWTLDPQTGFVPALLYQPMKLVQGTAKANT